MRNKTEGWSRWPRNSWLWCFPIQGITSTSVNKWWFTERWCLLTHLSFLGSLFAGSVLVVNEITDDLLTLPHSSWGEGTLYLFCLWPYFFLRTVSSNGLFLPLISWVHQPLLHRLVFPSGKNHISYHLRPLKKATAFRKPCQTLVRCSMSAPNG